MRLGVKKCGTSGKPYCQSPIDKTEKVILDWNVYI